MGSPLFVEILTLRVLFHLWKRRSPLQLHRGAEVHVLYGVSPLARRIASWLGWAVREVQFDLVDDVRLADGSPFEQETFLSSLSELAKKLDTQPAFRQAVRQALRSPSHQPYAEAYLTKQLGWELGASMRSIIVAGWYARSHLRGAQPTLLLRPGWLSDLTREYGLHQGVRVEPWIPATEKGMDKLFSPYPGGGVLRAIRKKGLALLRGLSISRASSQGRMPAGTAKVAVEMYMNGTLTDRGAFTSDLFWYRKEEFPAGSLLAYFRHPKDQPRGERAKEIRRQGIEPVDRAQMVRWGKAASQRRSGRKIGLAAEVANHLEDFYREYDFWAGFCRATGARIHVTMYKQFPEHEARHVAFHDAGGIAVAIQRSVEREPHLLRRTVVDVNFTHCRDKARVERESRSRIGQVVVTGYPFDSAFPEARRQGAELRERLRKQGARFILCYLDQNEGSHRKMLGGQERIREHYRFLCEKVAANPELGLILKPKRSDSLPARLGPVWDLVQQRVKTGRCIILGSTGVDSRYLPCAAATGADVAINLAYAATAGLESRLAGTRVLLLATPGVNPGIFLRFPAGSVLVHSWAELWKAVE